jgi:hypothetical protein
VEVLPTGKLQWGSAWYLHLPGEAYQVWTLLPSQWSQSGISQGKRLHHSGTGPTSYHPSLGWAGSLGQVLELWFFYHELASSVQGHDKDIKIHCLTYHLL